MYLLVKFLSRLLFLLQWRFKMISRWKKMVSILDSSTVVLLLTLVDSTFKEALESGLNGAILGQAGVGDSRLQQTLTLFEMAMFYEGGLPNRHAREYESAPSSRRRRQSLDLEATLAGNGNVSKPSLPAVAEERRVLGLKRRRVDLALHPIGLLGFMLASNLPLTTFRASIT
jgi:hypothetical protein